MKRVRMVAALCGVLFLVVACGGSDETDTGAQGETSTEAPTTEEATTEAPSETEAPESSDEPEETTTEAPDDSVDAGPTDGMEIYEANCARCHSSDGTGGRGRSLIGIAEKFPDPQDNIDKVNEGGSIMPEFADELSDEQIEAVVTYIRETFVEEPATS